MKDAILFDITDIILYLLTMHENEFLNAIHGDVSTLWCVYSSKWKYYASFQVEDLPHSDYKYYITLSVMVLTYEKRRKAQRFQIKNAHYFLENIKKKIPPSLSDQQSVFKWKPFIVSATDQDSNVVKLSI